MKHPLLQVPDTTQLQVPDTVHLHDQANTQSMFPSALHFSLFAAKAASAEAVGPL